MIVGTSASRRLCEEVSVKSQGTCLLGFSRGKDSLAAWLWLLEFFPRVIPFHCAAVPGLSFVDKSLDYYELQFGQPIHRCVVGELYEAIGSLYFQPIEDENEIDGYDWADGYGNDAVADQLKHELGISRAWTAWGICRADSIARLSAKKYRSGKNEKRRTFYPCFDWSRKQIMAAIEESELCLPDDYLLANRSFAGIPTVRHLERMRERFPDDFARIKLFYPFIESQLARNEFRRRHQRGQVDQERESV